MTSDQKWIIANPNFRHKLMVITHSEMKELCCGLPYQMHVKKPMITVLKHMVVDFI